MIPADRRQRPPIGGLVLGALMLVLLVGILGAALALGVFSSPSEPTRSSAELVQMAPDAIAGAPGLGYRLSIETNEAGGGQGLASSGEIDLRGNRFAGSADPGGAASMLLFGGPDRGSVVLADGLFVQADGGPWEAVPIENATPLRPFVDPSALSTAVAGALGQAQVDPELRTESCGARTCQVVSLLFPPRVTSDLVAFVSGESGGATAGRSPPDRSGAVARFGDRVSRAPRCPGARRPHDDEARARSGAPRSAAVD